MAINIKNREAEALLAEIREATGKGTSQIVRELAQAEAQRLRRLRDIDERRRQIDEITRRAAAKIPPDAPTPDEIIGYDEHGLPS
jgi:antitoxin VapB